MCYKYLLLALTLLSACGFNPTDIGLAATTNTRDKLSNNECQAIRQKLQRLQSQLRQGMTAKQGRKVRAQMRELELKYFRGC